MNIADRMLEIYASGSHAARMGEHLNPYDPATAEHHCWAHGWQDEIWEIDDAIEALMSGGPHCGGIVVDGLGRVLAQARPMEGGAA